MAEAGLLQCQLVHLALHNNDLSGARTVVQPKQDLLGARHLGELLVQGAVLDVDELAVLEVRERWWCTCGQRLKNFSAAGQPEHTGAPRTNHIHIPLVLVRPALFLLHAVALDDL